MPHSIHQRPSSGSTPLVQFNNVFLATESMTATTINRYDKARTISRDGTSEIVAALRPLLADTFCLYIKTKNFHWHIQGPHFRDYHLLLDEQAEQVFAITDDIGERARKLGGTTLRSIGDVTRYQRLKDNDREGIPSTQMLAELRSDNVEFAGYLRAVHEICAHWGDLATTSMIEVWIDHAEHRAWVLASIVFGEGR